MTGTAGKGGRPTADHQERIKDLEAEIERLSKQANDVGSTIGDIFRDYSALKDTLYIRDTRIKDLEADRKALINDLRSARKTISN
jgi:chromosome segregation ATPase